MELQQILDTIKSNQLLATGLGVYGAGVATFLLRNIPDKIFRFLKRHLTTTITITSQNNIFHDSIRWFEKEFKNKNFRTIKLSNGKYGYNSNTVKSIGYGSHWTIYNKQPIMITLIKEEGNKTEYDKDTLQITKFGRKHDLFNKLISGFKTIEKDDTKTEVYKLTEKCWNYARDQIKRPLNSVFLEKEKKDSLLKRLEDFINKEDWYKANGIPYQLGILLYGAPGTGKSSSIKAIAAYLNYDIYYLDTKNLQYLEDAVSKLPDKSILVIEDIDSNKVTHSREKDESKVSNKEDILGGLQDISLSSMLNSLDGMFSAHGRILIATTNHIEKLDSALIRPGRIDIKIEIGYVNKEILEQFLSNFFPNNTVNLSNIRIKNNLTVAELQNLVLEEKSVDQILEFCKEE